MLRIQSRLNHVLTESTRTHTHHSAHHCAHNEVYSLDKRDRRSLFQRTQISPGPASFAAHVSLSSHLQLSNNRPEKPGHFPVKPQALKPGTPISITANPGNSRARNFVASSAAALVSDRAYKGIVVKSSIAKIAFQKKLF